MFLPQSLILQSFNALNDDVAKQPGNVFNYLINNLLKPLEANQITTQDVAQKFKGIYNEFSSHQSREADFSTSVGISGSYAGYSGSVTASYSNDSYQASTHFNSSFLVTINKGTVYYNNKTDYSAIRSCLSTAMLTALNAIVTLDDAQKFTETYGTHIIIGVNLGGTLSLITEAKTTTYSNKMNASITTKATYSGIGSVSATATAAYSLTQKGGSEGLTLTTVTSGGDSSLASAIEPKKPDSMVAWANSCTTSTVYGLSDSLEIWHLSATKAAGAVLQNYINLVILAQSINNPTIFFGSTPLDHSTNAIAVTSSNYKIIGGGATVPQGCSSFLIGSYPETDNHNNITGWAVSCHDIDSGASGTDSLTAYAIAVYDPGIAIGSPMLAVNLVTANGSNKGSGFDSTDVAIAAGYTLAGGGCNSDNSTGNGNKFMMCSAPDPKNQKWLAASHDCEIAASDVVLTAYAIGIRCSNLDIENNSVQHSIIEDIGGYVIQLGDSKTIAGGGIAVEFNPAQAGNNFVQQLYPSDTNSWASYHHDVDETTRLKTQYYAFSLSASLKLQ